MSEINLRRTGGKAVFAVVLIVGFLGSRYVTQRTTLATEAADELRFWLAAEYVAAGLPALEEAVAAGKTATTTAQVQELAARNRITFTSLSARGRDDDIVVKAEVLVDGGPPPTGGGIRYFRMEHSMVTGWRMRHETTALSYHLRLF